MKLLHITPYYPPHVGGLQSHAQQFNQHLNQQGTTVTVFTPQLPITAPQQESPSPQLTIMRFPAFEIIPNYPLPKFWQLAFWRQWQRLNTEKFDIVISRTRFFFTSLIALRFARKTHTPWLHIEHGSDFVSLTNPLTKLLARLYDYALGRLVLKSADRVVANSHASARFVQKLAHRPAQVIYRGVDKETIANTPPDQSIRQTHQNKAIITFIGRLIDGKGVNDLLRAILQLAKYQIPDTRYQILIIGTGPQENNLKQLAKQLGLPTQISFLGQQSFKKAIAILKSSDVFVNPSHTEGLPTSVIEAALCKVAIIATNVGGTPEIITDSQSGCLIPLRKPNILAQKLHKLITNPSLRQTFANHAHQEVAPKFDWQHSIDKYTSLFQQLTN